MSISSVEQDLDTVEVRSSSLLVPTISFNGLAILAPFFVAPKRSISGLSSWFFEPFSAQVLTPTGSSTINHINNKDAELFGVGSRTTAADGGHRIIEVLG